VEVAIRYFLRLTGNVYEIYLYSTSVQYRYPEHTSTWLLTFLAWYRDFNKQWRDYTCYICPILPC